MIVLASGINIQKSDCYYQKDLNLFSILQIELKNALL